MSLEVGVALVAVSVVAALALGFWLGREWLLLSASRRLTQQQQLEAPQGLPPEERAMWLLQALLPQIRSRDDAMDNLYYVYPNATPGVRISSVAAALYILGIGPPQPPPPPPAPPAIRWPDS